jgi:hypothetical protein
MGRDVHYSEDNDDLGRAVTELDSGRAEALRRARARWRAAEDRLFPVALVDPDGYRRLLSVVAALLQKLRASTTSLDHLLELDSHPAPLVASACVDGAADRMALEAAFAVRDRELVAAAERDRRTRAIAAARNAGAAWVDLEGSWEAVCRTGTRHTEMYLASGRALVATVDPYSGEDPHRLEVVLLDSDTGTPVEATDQDQRFADRATWLAERERWRAQIERGSRQ